VRLGWGGGAGGDALDAWLHNVAARIGFVREFHEDELTFDFSGDSLEEWEGYLRYLFDTPAELAAPAKRWLVEGMIAYVGETLLRLGGGGWRAADEPDRVFRGLLVIEADGALGLPVVSPADLAVEVVRDRREGLLAGIYREWQGAVAAHRAAHPGWTPTKRRTPGLDPRDEAADARWLRDWLAARERTFPDWAARYGGGVAWDFSAGSVEALGALVRRLTPTADELAAPANAAFVDGATWYLGEALRRVKGGAWHYRSGDPGRFHVGRQYVRQSSPYDESSDPLLDLRLAVERGDPRSRRPRAPRRRSRTTRRSACW
jgi:hypothetical protein